MHGIRGLLGAVLVAAAASAPSRMVPVEAAAQQAATACGCGGSTPRPHCAFHQGPCNPSGTARLEGVTLATDLGTVHVVLPPDIAAGDTISGTVFAEPREGEATDALEGYVLETPEGKHELTGEKQSITFAVLSSAVPFVLRDRGGHEVARGQTPPSAPGLPEQAAYRTGPPRAVKRGDGFPVGGEFDGNAATTDCSLGGTPLDVIAESPRGVFLAPAGPVPDAGPTTLRIGEQGRVTEVPIHLVQLSLTADKLALHQGERTQVHTTIDGLEGVGKGECYVELALRAGSAARFAGAAGDRITHEVEPGNIRSDGTYRFDVGVVGTRPGGFTITAALLAGNEKTFTFTNGTGQAVNDLHIEWSRGVTVKADAPFGTTSGSTTSRTDHSDGNVANGATGTVTVDWDGTMPKVKQWWWTNNGKQVGGKNKGDP